MVKKDEKLSEERQRVIDLVGADFRAQYPGNPDYPCCVCGSPSLNMHHQADPDNRRYCSPTCVALAHPFGRRDHHDDAQGEGNMIDKDVLSMVISEAVFHLTNFGPSKSITDPYAEAVIAEAEKVHVTLTLP